MSETLARHFIAVGLKRAAVRCEQFAAVATDDSEDEAKEATAKAFELARLRNTGAQSRNENRPVGRLSWARNQLMLAAREAESGEADAK